jgi:hypothetical protein
MVVKEARQVTMDVIGKLSPSGARAFATAVMRGDGREQVTKAAHDVLEWSNRTRERVAELVRAEVRAQLKQVGVASREEVDALRRRVRELERSAGAKATGARRPSTRRPAAERPVGDARAASPATG